jgi:hypothetical protein
MADDTSASTDQSAAAAALPPGVLLTTPGGVPFSFAGATWALSMDWVLLKNGKSFAGQGGNQLALRDNTLYITAGRGWYTLNSDTGSATPTSVNPLEAGAPPAPPPAPAPSPTPVPPPPPPPPAPSPTPSPTPGPAPAPADRAIVEQIADPALVAQLARQADAMAANARVVSTATDNVPYARHAVWLEAVTSAQEGGALADEAILAGDRVADAYFERFGPPL